MTAGETSERRSRVDDPPETPAGARFASLASVLLLLALVAVITGLLLLPFYSATAERAHASVQAMERSFPLRVLRGAHHWASALLILLGAVHIVFGLFTSSYRRPLHWVWIAAVCLVLLFLFFQLTGHLLPWDAHGVSSTVIEIGIAENVPGIGRFQARLLRGDDAVSPRTLRLWYLAHVALLPVALAALAALLVAQLRRLRVRLAAPGAAAALLLVLLLAAVALPVPLGPQATPADYVSYTAPPEWYILPMHGLLRIAQSIRPELSFIGTMVLPGLAVALLLALPWMDRRSVADPPRAIVRGATALGVVGALILSLINVDHMAPVFGGHEPPAEPAIVATPPATAARLDPALVARGKAVYDAIGCVACHAMNGSGGAAGPPLDNAGTRRPDLDWQIRHLKDPSAVVRGSTMPPYNHLSEDDLRALATYMLSLK